MLSVEKVEYIIQAGLNGIHCRSCKRKSFLPHQVQKDQPNTSLWDIHVLASFPWRVFLRSNSEALAYGSDARFAVFAPHIRIATV